MLAGVLQKLVDASDYAATAVIQGLLREAASEDTPSAGVHQFKRGKPTNIYIYIVIYIYRYI